MTAPEQPPQLELHTPTRWLVFVGAAVGLVVLVVAGRFLAQQQGWIAKGSMDGPAVADEVKQSYEKQFPGLQLDVTCPASIPIQKNKTTDCTVTNQKGDSSPLFITVTDLDGHFTLSVEDYTVLYPPS